MPSNPEVLFLYLRMPALSLSKAERLKSGRTISMLFAPGGQAILSYPVRVVWVCAPLLPGHSTLRIGFSVPKRNFKTAVLRNRLRRRLREAWRLHQHELRPILLDAAPPEHAIALMFIYIAKEELTYAEIERGVKKIAHKFPKRAS